MANSSIARQLDLTIKLIVTLIAEPRISARVIAKALGVSEDWVHKMTGLLRDAGLDVEYDRQKGQYSVGLSEDLAAGLLGKYSRRLKTSLTKHAQLNPPIRFVSTLDRYDVRQFANFIGTTPQNIYNMISGYKGQALPVGWVAYQLAPNGKWYIQKMTAGRSGKDYTLPDNVKSAHEHVVGTGKKASIDGSVR